MPEAAKIYAQDAIRSKNEINRYKNLSSKLKAVSGRLENAYKTQKLTGQMKSLTETLSSCLNTSDLVKVCFVLKIGK